MLKSQLKSGPVWALGTMSGTSLDGVDAAMVLTDGARIFGFGESEYRAYTEAEREILAAALGQWDDLDEATALVETAHAECLSQITGMDLIAFHGQTVAHEPGRRGTLQIGDGRLLAHVLDCPVVWDFRSADVEMGGQGAPLAPFFHHACARWMKAGAPMAFLNLGGVGNLTWVEPRIENPAEDGACLAFDTGPANAPLDDLMKTRRGKALDRDGALAAQGTPDADILDRLSRHGFFAKMPPKSLDRNDFGWLSDAVAGLSDVDAAATLTAAIVQSVVLGIEQCPSPPDRILVTGGGRLNPVLMQMLSDRCDCSVAAVETEGLDGDMLEAQAFGYLAVRVVRGWPTSAPGTTGVAAPVGGGILSMPGDAARALGAAE